MPAVKCYTCGKGLGTVSPLLLAGQTDRNYAGEWREGLESMAVCELRIRVCLRAVCSCVSEEGRERVRGVSVKD